MKRFLAAALLLVLASTAHAQTQMQFWNAPWQGFAPGRIQCGQLYGANFNITSDQAIPISVPSGIWMVDAIEIDEAYPQQPSVSLTTASGGFYTAVSKGGVAVVGSGQAYSSITTNAVNTTGNSMLATIATAGNTTAFQGFGQASKVSTLYFSLTTAQGAAAAANIRVYCRPLY
jgi:hypothetical protein